MTYEANWELLLLQDSSKLSGGLGSLKLDLQAEGEKKNRLSCATAGEQSGRGGERNCVRRGRRIERHTCLRKNMNEV